MKHPYTITHEHPASENGQPVILKNGEVQTTTDGIKGICDLFGWTSNDLAEVLNISVKTVSNWRGKSPIAPSAKCLNHLSNVIKDRKVEIKIRCILEDGTDFSKVVFTTMEEAQENHLGKSFTVDGAEKRCVEVLLT